MKISCLENLVLVCSCADNRATCQPGFAHTIRNFIFKPIKQEKPQQNSDIIPGNFPFYYFRITKTRSIVPFYTFAGLRPRVSVHTRPVKMFIPIPIFSNLPTTPLKEFAARDINETSTQNIRKWKHCGVLALYWYDKR